MAVRWRGRYSEATITGKRLAMSSNDPQDASDDSSTVVDITSRLRAAQAARAASSTNADEQAEFAATHWENVLRSGGLLMEEPVPPGAVLEVVAAELERLFTGGLFRRVGGGPRDLPPNPDAGMDLTSVLEATSVLREMGQARETLRRMRQG
jgi:hypothetical protein